MYYDGLAIAAHVLTPSAGLPDYCASAEKVVCNGGTYFAQSGLKQIYFFKKKESICLSIQRNSLHLDYGKSQKGRRALLNLPNSL